MKLRNLQASKAKHNQEHAHTTNNIELNYVIKIKPIFIETMLSTSSLPFGRQRRTATD